MSRPSKLPVLAALVAFASACASAPAPAPSPSVRTAGEIAKALDAGEALRLGAAADHGAVIARIAKPLPAHLHRRRTEVVVVLGGGGEMTVGTTRHRLAPGTVIYLPPGVPHDVTPGPEGVDAVIVRIPPTGDEDTFPVR